MRVTFLLSQIALALLGLLFLFDEATWVATALVGVLMVGFFVFVVEAVLTLCGAVSFFSSCHKDGLR